MDQSRGSYACGDDNRAVDVPYRMIDKKSRDPHLGTQSLFLPVCPHLQVVLGNASVYGKRKVNGEGTLTQSEGCHLS